MSVKVILDIAKVTSKIKKASKVGQIAMAQQALKDSNFYAKQDSGIMIASSIKASNLKKGKLVWNAKYARRQYYLKAANRDVNPNAREMWAHYAAKQHGDEWQSILQKAINKGV